ncbi:MAG: hypothetical protein ACYDGM_05710 [Vulcanimicrobiaceae bacterium]
MSTRKAFLAAAAVVGASMTVQHEAALAQSSATPTPAPSPSPAAPPSAAARALAQRMRAFDPHLDDAQIERIAGGIQEGLGLGSALNPNGTKLKNSDAPTPEFEVAG